MKLFDKFMDWVSYSKDEQVPTEWKKRKLWNSIPTESTADALLILSKSILTEVQALQDDAAQYAPGSMICHNLNDYIGVLMVTLRDTIIGLTGLTDTPIGDGALIDALALAQERYELEVSQEGQA